MVVAGCVPAGILLHGGARSSGRPTAEIVEGSLVQRLKAVEMQLIQSALKAAKGNKSKAADLLKVKRSTLGDRIKKLGLDDTADAGSS
jgi:transcriptional regulator with PAS, ATPase and Fis domain